MADRTELTEQLALFERELNAAEIAASLAIKRVESLRLVVQGLEDLLDAGKVDAGPTLFDIPPSPFSRRIPYASSKAQPSNGELPRGRKAVRQVLIETRRAWKIADLAEEIERRGWMPDAARIRDSVSSSVQRLVTDGDVERVKHGVYRYRLDKLPPQEEQHET